MSGFEDARQFWNQRFDTSEYIFGKAPNVFLKSEMARIPPGARVLDVACGEGRNAVWLATQGCRVTGVDISPRALDKAQRLAGDQGVVVDWREMDVRDWDWVPGSFDVIVCIFIQFASPSERSRLFEGFGSALIPGGLVVLQGYTPGQLAYRTGGPGDAAHMYTPELLRDAFSGFDILRLEDHDTVLAEGTKHVGKSAVIDLVARKRP